MIHYYIEEFFRELALLVAFVLLVSSWFLLKRSLGFIRSIRAVSWPTAEGRIETANVQTFSEQALAEVGYSYLVEANRYSGYFSQQFADEQQAWDYVEGLRGRAVLVRYRQDDPDISVLRVADQQSYINLRGSGFVRLALGAIFERLRDFYPRRL